MHTITVKPLGERNWMLEYSGAQNALVFLSGATAERAGRGLPESLAGAGRSSRLSIYLRDGSLAGSYVGVP
jgi:hypothetical protein